MPSLLERPAKTKRGKNYAKAPEQLEAVETGQQRPRLERQRVHNRIIFDSKTNSNLIHKDPRARRDEVTAQHKANAGALQRPGPAHSRSHLLGLTTVMKAFLWRTTPSQA